MKEYRRLSHTRWNCKYYVVFIPNRSKKRIFAALRRHLGEMFRNLAGHKESKIVEGHLMGNHVHMRSGQCGGVSQGQECDTNCA